MKIKRRIKRCKLCGKITEVSKRGYCQDCGFQLMVDAVRQLQERQGPIYEKWKRGLEASIERS